MALLPVGAAQRMTWTWPVPAPHVEDRWALSSEPQPACASGTGFSSGPRLPRGLAGPLQGVTP